MDVRATYQEVCLKCNFQTLIWRACPTSHPNLLYASAVVYNMPHGPAAATPHEAQPQVNAEGSTPDAERGNSNQGAATSNNTALNAEHEENSGK
jgi:hypothetical protein